MAIPLSQTPAVDPQNPTSQPTIPVGSVVNNGSGPVVNTSFGAVKQPGAVPNPNPTPAPTADQTYSRIVPNSLPIPNNVEMAAGNVPAVQEASKIAQLQSAVQGVSEVYDKKIADYGSGQGNSNEGTMRSVAALSGLAGSTGADSKQSSAAGTNSKNVDALQNERATKINAIYSQMGDAQTAFDTAKASADAATAKQNADVADKRATAILQAFGKELNGATFQQFKTADPKTYDSLLNMLGGNDAKLELLYNASMPTPIKYDFTTIPGKALYTDPITNKPNVIDLGVEPKDGYSLTVTADGTPLLFNKTSGDVKIAPGFEKGQLAKPADALDTEYKQAQIDKIHSDIATANNSGNAVSPDVLSGMMNIYKSTGVVPPLGNSAKSPLRAQFYAALGSPDGAQTVSDANTNKVVRAGITTAYKTQQNLYAANQTAINTLDKQLDLAKTYSDQVDRPDSPLVAKYTNSLKSGVFGDPDTAAFNNIVKTASMEFAKILSGSAASVGGVTVNSAADAEQMLNTAMSKGQFNEVMGLMKKEAEFRLGSQKGTLDQLEKDSQNVGTLSSDLNNASTPAVGSSVSDTSSLPDGTQVQGDDGKTYVIKGGKPVAQ